MAVKPRSEWTAAYRRRVERAEAAGKSRQAARGHKAKEHVARKVRELSLGGLTTSQRQQVRKFAREQSVKAGEDREFFVADMLSWADHVGYEMWSAVRDKQRSYRRQYKSEVEEGSYVSRGEGWLRGDAEVLNIPDNDIGWLYYHS